MSYTYDYTRAAASESASRRYWRLNLLAHYDPVNHDIIDKYEIAPGVINQDIVEFTPQQKYDLIMSTST